MVTEAAAGFHIVKGGDHIPRNVRASVNRLVAGRVGNDPVNRPGDSPSVARFDLGTAPSLALDCIPVGLCGGRQQDYSKEATHRAVVAYEMMVANQ